MQSRFVYFCCLFAAFSISKARDEASAINNLVEVVETLKQEVEDLKLTIGEVGSLKKTVADQAEQISELRERSQNNFIGFTAYNNGDQELNDEQTVIYDTAATNVGDGFDTVTGIFTCPISGLYFFGIASFSRHSYVDLQLVKENSALTGAHSDTSDWDQGANFWVTECSEGNRVWVKQVNPDGGTLAKGTEGNILHSFVGFLIGLST